MSVSTRKLIYDFERKVSALNSNKGKSIRIVDAVSIINESYEILFENNVRLAETDSRYRDNLRQLEIKKKSLSIKHIDDNCVFATYPRNLYKRLNHVLVAKKDCCSESKVIVPNIVQSDDLHIARKDPYRRADFGFEQALIDEAGNGIYIYHDGEFDVEKCEIDYIRKINHIQAPSLVECKDKSYIQWDLARITKDVDFDIDSTYFNRKVSDVAALLYTRDTKDIAGFELQLKKIISIDNIT